MTREDIIRMAREAGRRESELWLDIHVVSLALAAAAAERERMTVNTTHTCHAECDRPGCVRVREAVKAEREASADYAAALAEAGWSAWSIADALRAKADALRARGET